MSASEKVGRTYELLGRNFAIYLREIPDVTKQKLELFSVLIFS
jgi:hypothetical protein